MVSNPPLEDFLLPSRRYPFGTWLLSSTLRVLRMISWWLGQWPLAVAEILVRQSLGPRSLRGWCIVARRRCHASARRNSLHKAEPTPDEIMTEIPVVEFLSPFGFDLCIHLYTYLAWDVEPAHEILLHTTWDKMRYFARVSRLALFVLLFKTASSSFLPDTFTAWFWQSCKYLSPPY